MKKNRRIALLFLMSVVSAANSSYGSDGWFGKPEEKKPGASYTPTNPNTGKESENKSWFPKPSLPAWMKPEPKPKTTPAQPSMWTKTKKNTKAAWDKTITTLNPFDEESKNKKKAAPAKESSSWWGRGKQENDEPKTTTEFLGQKSVPY